METNPKHVKKCEEFVDNPQVKRKKPSMPTSELILPLTSFMYFGMVDFGTIIPTSLMTAHVKGH